MNINTPFEIEVRSRFGNLVRADVYLPPGKTGRFPVIFAAAPYLKSLKRYPTHPVFAFRETGPIEFYLERGYAFVWADSPGSGRSEGAWDGWSRAEACALSDVIEWVAMQDWCTGKIGMTGESGFCWSSWNVARVRPPHLTTIVAYDGGVDMYREWMYNGGIPGHVFGPYWITMVMLRHQAEGHDIANGDWYKWLNEIYAHPLDDAWQRDHSPLWELGGVDIPVFSIGCWGKRSLHLSGNFAGFHEVRGPKQLLIEYPEGTGEAQRLFGREDFHEREVLPWFEHHLKGLPNGVMERPAVRFFIQREGRYDSANTWPPQDSRKATLYLSGARSGAVRSLNDGSLVDVPPSVEIEATSWNYPHPHWEVGYAVMENGAPNYTAGICTYTSAPFDMEREFTGDGVLVLHASTDQTDMDLIVRLMAVAKDGRAQKVTQGWLRGSHRAEHAARSSEMRPFHGHQCAEPMTPGEIHVLRIELIPMSFLIAKGERLRLEISNIDSMAVEGPMAHWYGLKMGCDTYHHDKLRPSRLVLHERARGEKRKT
ncbi:MAG: CocE/NonD family hydrolase [Betaproteobacteria bacterium]|nr:CocE/NonD family hydrolase [Betaproteobacteria bacterium]